MSQSEVKRQIAVGAIWMIFMRFVMKGISIISTLILVRLLEPEDFGLMALATSIFAFVELIRKFGFGTALIQDQKATREDYDTAWTLQIIFSLTASAITVAISELAADYYNDYRIAPILMGMAIMVMVNGFSNIGVVEFQKKLTFNKEFNFRVLVKLTGFFVTITTAWYLRSYWALLIGTLANSFVTVILSYVMQDYRPKVTLAACKKLFSFTSWLMINNVLFFFSQHAQNFVLGRVSGSNVLGIFTVANEVASTIAGELVAPINRAAYPGYSKVSEDRERLREIYLDIFQHICLFVIPCGFGLAVVAPVMVPVVLGEKWFDTIPTIQLISLASIFTAMTSNASYVFLALKKQYLNTFTVVFKLIVFFVSLFFFVEKYGAIGAGLAMLVTSISSFPVSFILIMKVLKISFFGVINCFYRPLLASFFMVYAILYAFNYQSFIDYDFSNYILLIVEIIFGFFSFIIISFLLYFLAGFNSCFEVKVLKRIINKIKFK